MSVDLSNHPVELFRNTRLHGGIDAPARDAHPAIRLAWLIGQPDALKRRNEIWSALQGVKGITREQLAAACESKFFPTLASRFGMSVDQQAMLQMLQSIHAGR